MCKYYIDLTTVPYICGLGGYRVLYFVSKKFFLLWQRSKNFERLSVVDDIIVKRTLILCYIGYNRNYLNNLTKRRIKRLKNILIYIYIYTISSILIVIFLVHIISIIIVIGICNKMIIILHTAYTTVINRITLRRDEKLK